MTNQRLLWLFKSPGYWVASLLFVVLAVAGARYLLQQAPYGLVGDEAQVHVPDVPNWPWEGPIYPADKVTLSEARTRVPFAIPLPTSLRDARSVEIEEVWVSAVQAPLDLDEEIYTELTSVAVVFSDGCQMIIHQMDSPPDWDAIIAQQTPVFSKVTINDHPGMGTSPGVQEIMGGQHRYPGSVSWWVDGLEITIYSETLPLEELLEIANSVRY
ncbi:MAG: hypothetical protein GTO63_17275 [Anaerolineae bacterium]|nr:hypothetical protein [Anaerolineae bacterium]NIN96544.1 hypothetical protein [Anaerolineae bacterium]NIQ79573.1 hypothetical protein [Anaerolineae bacterium]